MSLFRRNLLIASCVLAAASYAVYHVHAQVAPSTPLTGNPNIGAIVPVSTDPTGTCVMNGTSGALYFSTQNITTGLRSYCVGAFGSQTWATDGIKTAGFAPGTAGINLVPSTAGAFSVNSVQLSDSTGAMNSNVAGESPVYTAYGNQTVAALNTGVTIVPATASRTIKLLYTNFIGVGGSPAATCTAVQIADTSAVVAVSLTAAGILSTGTNTDVTPTAGAWTYTTYQTALTAGAGLKISSTGSTCTTITSLNYKAMYTYQ